MSKSKTKEINQEKAEAFAERMLEVLNGASLALMTSIGHQTGLFDTMAELPPSTSAEIAESAGLHERYVREWLGAMVTGRIVEYDSESGTYYLPPEHAASLTRAAGTGNMANFMPYIPLCGSVEGKIIESFRNGGGVPYSEYPHFQELQAEETSAVFDETLVNTTLPLIPGMVERLREGIEVADIGCGCGHAINVLAEAFPNSEFTGYDISEDGLRAGREEAKSKGLSNAAFESKDVSALDLNGRYDLITAFDAIHDQAKPAKVLDGIALALKPGGTFLMVDMAGSSNVGENVGHPLAPFLYMISCMHCMTVSLAQGGDGLGAMWGEQKAKEMLAEAGFNHVEVKRIEGDIINNYYIARK